MEFQTDKEAALNDYVVPSYDTSDDYLFAKQVHKNLKKSKDHLTKWKGYARESYDFYAGNQWDAEDAQKLNRENRPVIDFNRIPRVINAVAGLELQNRQEVTYMPRTNADLGIADVLTDAANYVRDNCDAEDEESQMFKDCLVTGLGWCLAGDANVRLPNSHIATTRLYSGQIIEIDLENGQKLTGTPNHPVLTNTGWKRLHMLDKSDYLVTSNFLERIQGFPVGQFDEMESRLEDVVDAFRARGKALRMVTFPNDFNSDGVGSEIHIVYTDSLLRDKIINSSRVKKVFKPNLATGDLFAFKGVSFFSDTLLNGSIDATVGEPSFNIAHTPFSHFFSGGVISELIMRTTQALSNCFIGQPNLCSNLGNRQFAVEIQSPQLFQWNTRS